MGIPEDDLTQIGASPATRSVLETLKEEGHISELVDGYRLCIAVACAWNEQPDLGNRKNRTNMFGTNTIDSSGLHLRVALTELYPDYANTPYRVAESLAELGAKIVSERMSGTSIEFTELVDLASSIGMPDPS